MSAGYNTSGKVSFAATSTPQNLTDVAADEWLKSVVNPLPLAFQVACVRRLLYESQLMHVADLKSRVAGPSKEKVRKLRLSAMPEWRSSGVVLCQKGSIDSGRH